MHLKYYHNFFCPDSRRVWIALIEKKIASQIVSSDFPTSGAYIPTIEANGNKISESLAILDYLETEYPTPALLPQQTHSIAKLKAVEMLTLNQLQSPVIKLLNESLGRDNYTAQQLERAKQAATEALTELEKLLGSQQYLVSDRFTRAEIITGTLLPLLPSLGVSLSAYPQLQAWLRRLLHRPAWRGTQPPQTAPIPTRQLALA